MIRDELQAFMAMLTTDLVHDRRPSDPVKPRPLVTIARDHGAGGEAIATAVARALGVKCFDREIMEAVAARAHADPALVRALDERAPSRAGMFLYATLTGTLDPSAEYPELLERVVRGIAGLGGVIVGRGAHRFLPGALRVRVLGSDEACARRLAGGDAAAVPEKLAEVRRVNAARTAFFRSAFRTEHDEPRQYDLVINTDRIGDLDAAARMIVEAQRALTLAAPAADAAAPPDAHR